MGTIKIDVTADKVTKSLLNLVKSVSGQGILDDIAAIILRRNKERFLKGVDPNNNRWPESESAKRRRAGLPDSQGITRVGSLGNTLFSTGSLFQAIQVLVSRSTKTQRVVSVNPSFTNRKTGAKVIGYAVKHQLGKDGLPKREFLGINTEDRQVVNIFIERVLKRLG